MLTSLLASAAAPAFDAPVSGWNVGTFAFIAGLVIAAVGIAAVFMSRTQKLRDIMASIVVGAMGLSVVAIAVGGTLNMNETAAIKAEHRTEVQEWLAAQYDIDVSETAVKHLLRGDPVSVDYDGQKTRVVLTRDTDNRVDAFEAAGTRLTPTK